MIVVSGGAYFTAFSMRCSRIWRSRGASASAWWRDAGLDVEVVLADDRPIESTTSCDRGLDVGRLDGGRDVRARSGPTEDRVDEAVQALDLVHRRVVPRVALGAPLRVARLATLERRVVGEELGVGPDDGERRPQLVGDERDQLAAGLVDPASSARRASASVCWRPFSTMPASRSAIARSWATSAGAERRGAARSGR